MSNEQQSSAVRAQSKTPYTDEFTTDFTEKVKKNVQNYIAYGREEQISKVFKILLNTRKNSPSLIGDAGVGKSAIVEGICAEIALAREGKNHVRIPDEFKNIRIRSLEVSSILNEKDGENALSRLKHIVEELSLYKKDNILFIDEVHTIMGSGANGALDIGNALKPALARGEIYFISATTYNEFTIIEKDAAMERRLNPVYVDEPSRDEAVGIIEKVKKRNEKLHKITYDQEALEASVDFSIRYMADKQLPDKAIDLIDEAGSAAYYEGRSKVTVLDIAQLIHEKKGIPIETILRISRNEPVDYEKEIKKVVKGQDHAVKQVCQILRKSATGMKESEKPSSILFMGTTGTGKTELAKQVARVYFGDESAFLRLDMSEYTGEKANDALIGDRTSGKKGDLTEFAKIKPYSVILLDELEKADRTVHNLLLGVLDAGRLKDATGRLINFKECIIIGTTNAGHQTIRDKFRLSGGFGNLSQQENKAFMENLHKDLSLEFAPEMINRWNAIVVMNMLLEDVIHEITNSRIRKKEAEWEKYHNIIVEYQDDQGNENREGIYNYLKNIGTDELNGARPLARAIETVLTDPISDQLYYIQRSRDEVLKAIVVLHGTAPRETSDGHGRYSVVDRRAVDIRLEKIEN
ncbi:ATP-dependent Clp protease ATP-binding subunit [Streptococcus sanguinis]|uniref:AAA family ATPase n=1 Tax=Streptococcus sanguinis TaxID=1305 RepID=UPI002283E87A|nr:ATP-dependent Clp protease ATP-binding subunit [Streptococcus sanguinis]MCY7041682.1 ATP-dependent Clp protease ATP-binding subunit [Streptococcus sanguinis]